MENYHKFKEHYQNILNKIDDDLDNDIYSKEITDLEKLVKKDLFQKIKSILPNEELNVKFEYKYDINVNYEVSKNQIKVYVSRIEFDNINLYEEYCFKIISLNTN
jgi:hypothetical protein